MAKTTKQQLAAAKAALAATKKRLAEAQAAQASLATNTGSGSANKTVVKKTQADVQNGQQRWIVTWSDGTTTNEYAPAGSPAPKTTTPASTATQDQAVSAIPAADAAALINEQYGNGGVVSTVDPVTGKVVTDTGTIAGNVATATYAATSNNKTAAQLEAERLAQVAKDSQAEADRLAQVAQDSQTKSEAAAAALKAAQDAQDAADAAASAGTGGTSSDTGASTGDTGAGTGDTGAGAGGDSSGSGSGFDATKYLVDLQTEAAAKAAQGERQSAYDTLYNEFNKYGLGSLVEDIKGLITDQSASPSQFAIALQNTDAYKKRFSANQSRIQAGLRALTPAEYIGMEDQYQNIMRTYGLPASYYTKDSTGKQEGFDKFLANDVSATELEDRIATAQQRVINSNPEVLQALKQFYPDINNADILSYALDPQNALTNIKRKVTAAEIGGAAISQGLQAQGGTAESLAGLGITKAQAQQGYTDIAGMLPRTSQLSDIYNQGPYNQATAEAEVFNTAGAAQAAAKRKKLAGLETASFSGSSGVGSLNRDRAVSNYMLGQPGAGSY